MNNYYTYAYLREDGTPYYIGKGSKRRAYITQGRVVLPPKNKNKIIILKQNLTEEAAFKHEIYMIAVFGRKDLGTGILYNRTDGGDGSGGRSLESKEKVSKKMKGRTFSNEHKEKIRLSLIGKKMPPRTKIASINQSESQKKRYLITFDDGRQIEIKGIREWCENEGYNVRSIFFVLNNEWKKYKNIVSVTKIKVSQ